MLSNLMFACMRKNGFSQTDSIKDFRKACKKKEFKISEASCYRWYDKVAADVDMTGVYQQNINQYFTDLTKISSKASRKYLNSDGSEASYALDDYLRVAELQMKALNLQQTKTGDQNSIFMQFMQQNNNAEINVNETLASITEGLGEFGPLLQRLTAAQVDTGKRAIPAISTASEAKDTL